MAEIPVLISGGGPVGLSLAIELGLSGIPCTLVERRDGSVSLPKMSGLSIRSMEISRRLGVADEARKRGWPHELPNDMVYCTSLIGQELTRERLPSFDATAVDYSPERLTHCAQIYYDPLLLERARKIPLISLRHLTSLDSFTQDANGVDAAITDRATDRSETLRASYLIGCDGADGTVVEQVGVDYEGFGLVANSLNVFFRCPSLMSIREKGVSHFFRFVDGKGAWGEMIGIDGKELWRLSVLRSEPGLDGDAYIRRLVGTDVAYELLSVMPWERRERTASRYRNGRVFLCGDAAHQLSPTGGLGLHTGLQDALDLSWKLAAVLEGWGGDDLLDSYEVERKPIALVNGRVSTDLFNAFADLPHTEALFDETPAGETARHEFRAEFERHNGYRNPAFTENLRLGYCYEPSPLCVPDGTPRPPVEDPKFHNVARPGMRAPHAWLPDGRSTLDLFGNYFTLLRFGTEKPSIEALVDAAAGRRVPLHVIDIEQPEITALYERNLVLVRPDGHVAWRADSLNTEVVDLIDRVRGATPAGVATG